jgi:hypothetical protein
MNPVPDPIIVNTGEQHTVTKTIDDFFLESWNYIQENYQVQVSECQIKFGEIAYNPLQITNDRITYLSYRSVIVACVFETRTEFNYVQYSFFRNLDNLLKKQ